MKLTKFMTIALLIAFISLSYSTAQCFNNLSDCLVTNDIGKYIYDVKTTRLGNACGVVGGADHFKVDHVDSVCSGEYSNINEVRSYQTREEIVNNLISVDVQVTQHAGGDSDRWLLHEVEDGYRRGKELKATYSAPNPIRIIDNNTIWFQWGVYTWISNNVVVKVEYTDLQGTKPEPLEIVKAYLAKFPSTITLTNVDAKTSAHNIQWIKDEMDRRLWLCDKWNAQSLAGSVTQADLIYNLHRRMEVFLNYRQKYYGVAAQADINLLAGYKQNNDLASIQTKLTEYKTWWAKHKGKNIKI